MKKISTSMLAICSVGALMFLAGKASVLADVNKNAYGLLWVLFAFACLGIIIFSMMAIIEN